jgi:hypothetical protein
MDRYVLGRFDPEAHAIPLQVDLHDRDRDVVLDLDGLADLP